MSTVGKWSKGSLAMFAVTLVSTSVAQAQWGYNGPRIDNTPLDPHTWAPHLRPAEPSTFTDPNNSPVTGRWAYADGIFVNDGRGNWVEHRYHGRPQSHFREIGRSDSFVDLYDASRQIVVRLTNGQGLWRPQSGGAFGQWGTGTFR